MAGKNILWVAKQHGHSVSTMLTTYAAWTEGATDADIEAIKRAMDQRPRAAQIVLKATPVNPLAPPEFGTGLALESGGKGGTRTAERLSQISNLLMVFEFHSPSLPRILAFGTEV